MAVAVALAGVAAATMGVVVPREAVVDSAPVAVAASGGVPTNPDYPSAVDHCYVEGMIPHHEQALELSRLVLAADDVRERTRALAEFIVIDQQTEIEAMAAWQDAWARAIPVEGASSAHVGHHSSDVAGIPTGCGDHAASHSTMAGMATPEQLAALAAADGAMADRLFLELMIVHHEGALEMATVAVTTGSNAFVRSSAKHVLVEQDREIAAMSSLLAEAP
jgi:uncharacterized protein (DUF305 family)